MALLQIGSLIEGLHGKSGNSVFVRTSGGISVRDHVIPHDPKSPLQLAARRRLSLCADAWHQLSPEQGQAWRAYAAKLSSRLPGGQTGKIVRAQNIFNALACKVLQVNPEATIPLDPPSRPFGGDGVEVTVSAQEGQITFTANTANRNGVVTELLLQPLRSGASNPQAKAYRSQAFVAFSSDHLSEVVTLDAGWYACAYRLVNAATGQSTAMEFVKAVRVE